MRAVLTAMLLLVSGTSFGQEMVSLRRTPGKVPIEGALEFYCLQKANTPFTTLTACEEATTLHMQIYWPQCLNDAEIKCDENSFLPAKGAKRAPMLCSWKASNCRDASEGNLKGDPCKALPGSQKVKRLDPQKAYDGFKATRKENAKKAADFIQSDAYHQNLMVPSHLCVQPLPPIARPDSDKEVHTSPAER
ncbi:hypothetical protein K2X30_00550 [bacterium]|nr:hypothetical protein [bacterium]